jgi:hypothetical protein
MAEDSIDPKRFKYTLNIRGVQTEAIDNAPDGWLDTTITYKRSSTYNGLIRSLTLPMRFTLKAAWLLRKELYKYGILARVFLSITFWRKPYIYEALYDAKLDFSKAKDSQTHFEVDAIQNDFSIQVDAYDDVDFAIPLESDALTVTLPGLKLKEQPQFIFLPSTDNRSDCYPALQLVNYTPASVNASVQNAGFYADSFPAWDTSNNNFFYLARTDTIVNIKGHLEGDVSSFNNPRNFTMGIYKSGVGLIKTLYSINMPSSAPVPYNFDFDFSVNVTAGERLFFYWERVGSIISTEGFQVGKGDMTLSYQTISPDSTCKAYRVYSIYEKLLQLMNTTSPNVPNLPVPNQSVLLNTVWKDLVITCSDSIRPDITGQIYQAGDTLQAGGRYLVSGGAVTYNSHLYAIGEYFNYKLGFDTFTTIADGFVQQVRSTPSLILSFKTFYAAMRALQGGQIGFGQDNGLACLEDMTYFFRSGATSLDLGIINKFELSPAIELMCNAIKVGYKDQQFDKINGTQEVNSTQQYITDLLNPKKELDLVSPINGAPYFIEQVRTTPQDSAASRSDNDLHFIYLKDTPEVDGTYKPVQMDALLSYSGIDDVNYYNWYITPKRNLLRGGAYLASIFDKMDGYTIRMASGLKNTALITTDSTGLRVSEAANIPIANLPNKIFQPYYVSVLAGLGLYDLLTTPYGDIKFTYNDTDYKGFVDEIGIDVGENSAQTFKLLLTPDNNLLNLVH